ncbi:YceI family protein [Wenzhouxiangella sp. AB-CW3]|uniref:YceI family protein n=1 Tax=Wenzhouxiangella sp. AB-CW3 TaxID=2771012 RepID=UPI00168B0588|nr:YceI family protein [Wenzhouxiangella sp. AB-CW3]QOC23302.1 YceI family protein [Wenzhouxiangella sp. AB-CW3]
MAKTIIITLISAAAMLATTVVQADESCYTAGQENGELRFSGVAEGSPFRGKFGEFSVRLCLPGDDLTAADIEVTVQTGSADVGNRDGNQALKDDEFFAVDRFPEARWVSTEIARDGDDYLAEGSLSIKSLESTQSVTLSLQSDGESRVLSGSAEIMRLDWEVGTGEFEDTDFIRDRVDLRFDLQLQPEG